jgi:hypothetical protein
MRWHVGDGLSIETVHAQLPCIGPESVRLDRAISAARRTVTPVCQFAI